MPVKMNMARQKPIRSFDIKHSTLHLCRLEVAVASMEDSRSLQIPKTKLGEQGLLVSKLGFGCVGLTGTYNAPLSDEDAITFVKNVFSRGVTFFDTADSYGGNANEILLGKALKQLPREEIQLATKFGIVKMETSNMVIKGTPEYVRMCCEASIKRLDVDYIDLYYQHRVDTLVPIEETMGELKKLVLEGKIKYVGLSEASPDTIRRAHRVHPVTAIQIEWSLWSRDVEEEILPLCSFEEEVMCRELGIGVVTYSPLGRGFFAGKAVQKAFPSQSILSSLPRFTGENLEKNRILYLRLEKLAQKHKCTTAQLALAWILKQGDDVVPIPGTTKIKNLEENIDSLKVKLTPENLKEISDAVPKMEVFGLETNEWIHLHSWKYANTPQLNSISFIEEKNDLVDVLE